MTAARTTVDIDAVYAKAAEVIAAAPAATATIGKIGSTRIIESGSGDGYLVLVLVFDPEGWEVNVRWLIDYDGSDVTRLPDLRFSY